MPNKPKKVNRPWIRERKPFERDQSDYEFYNSWKWRKLSKRYKESHPLCVKCEQTGVVQGAQFTDHIQRIKDGGDPFDESNLQSLCEYHHNQKSGREAHGYKEHKEKSK